MKRDICVEVGLALVGEELEPRRNLRICVERGRVRLEEDARGSALVAIPAFFNAHLHVLDYAFTGLGLRVQPERLLPWPGGVKASLILSAPCRVYRSLSTLAARIARMGYAGVAAFIEGCGGTCRLVKRVFAQHSVLALTYGRCELNVLEGCDGLGAPTLYTRRWVTLALDARRHGYRVGAHVSETMHQSLLGDYEYALYVGLEHAVHLIHAPPRAVRRLATEGVTLVATPYSNIFYWGERPNWLKTLDTSEWNAVTLGTDNAGWLTLNPWEVARHTILILGRSEQNAKLALKALTVNAWSAFIGGCASALTDGSCTPILLLYAPEAASAANPLAALVSIGDVDMHYTILNPLPQLEAESSTNDEARRER